MAFKKALAHRFFNASNRLLFNNSAVRRIDSTNNLPLEPGDSGILRRFLHQRPNNFPPPSTFTRSLIPPLPVGFGNVMDQLAAAAGVVSRERIKLDGLLRPPPPAKLEGLTVEETRKLVRLTETVRLKRKLKEIQRKCITYQEFVRICEEDCSDGDQNYGFDLAKRLDDSGAVIVLGNLVFLDPEQIAKSIACLIPTLGINNNNNNEDSRTRRSNKELEEMEKQKTIIDGEARQEVRRELWCGLGFLVAQTAALMRLTFWELTWDVMEPICYFITSTYFMGGYAFFLTTSKEPSFEGLYQTRFVAKQKHFMKLYNFDVHKYNRLRRLTDSYSNQINLPSSSSSSSSNHQFL